MQQRHGRLQINSPGASVVLRLHVPVFDKDAAIAFALRLELEHHNNAETGTLNWLMYPPPFLFICLFITWQILDHHFLYSVWLQTFLNKPPYTIHI
jgi:hypothetical protein